MEKSTAEQPSPEKMPNNTEDKSLISALDENQNIKIPVVSIGASAGGLEAMEQFFKHLPEKCGAAFVVIQHLDPTQPGMLAELLQRTTNMPVTQAKENEKIKMDCVYVIPANKDISILHGTLHLFEPTAPRGLRLPIDFFFRSLAADLHEQAIGVILSGMGSDGALGLRAIKENAGLALVQSPESAKFDAMPHSAIDAGLADIIASPAELADRLCNYLHRTGLSGNIKLAAKQQLKTHSSLEQIIILLRDRTGNDFSLYKKNTIYRRIERRMGLHQIDTISSYVRYLNQNTQEVDLLFKELLIGVTNFFRDPAVWEFLRAQVIPELLSKYPTGKELRAWIPACSTGEEAYSLAMIFKEVVTAEHLQHLYKLQIFATDLDQDAIDLARNGLYAANIAADVSAERLSRFFNIEEQGFRINKDIREMVIFARQNIIMDPPFTKLDVLSCRNLMIYLGQELQKKLLPLFHFALTGPGVLLLGNSESINNFSNLFATIDNTYRLYRRIEQPHTNINLEFPTKYFSVPTSTPQVSQNTKSTTNLQTLIDQFLLQNYAPAAVVVNTEGDILYINGRTGKYLEPAAGKANWNIHAMAREGLAHKLTGAIKTAQRQTQAVFLPGLSIGTNGGVQTVNVTVQAISKSDALKDMLIVLFHEVLPAITRRSRKAPNAEEKALLLELQQSQEELQCLREEMQTSQEELKSSNEELQSTNEELQSTNEELTTSKEEMQSLNEELQSMNVELQSKVTDLSWVNNDMKNLLNSMEIATVFLDNNLHVRRFTSHATQLFKLIGGDIGRPLTDITTELDYSQLQTDALTVLNTLIFCEKQVKTHDNRCFTVRIMPYRTQDNVIDGLVITFIDISKMKSLEYRLEQAGN